jgi:hypothetical protein
MRQPAAAARGNAACVSFELLLLRSSGLLAALHQYANSAAVLVDCSRHGASRHDSTAAAFGYAQRQEPGAQRRCQRPLCALGQP